jgi:hypothetical protein
MATQSLRGMANHGPMHWRGDRNGALVPGGDSRDSSAAFHQFNPANVGLLGRAAQLPAADMDRFTNFILTVTYPPNPIRSLDDTGAGIGWDPRARGARPIAQCPLYWRRASTQPEGPGRAELASTAGRIPTHHDGGAFLTGHGPCREPPRAAHRRVAVE